MVQPIDYGVNRETRQRHVCTDIGVQIHPSDAPKNSKGLTSPDFAHTLLFGPEETRKLDTQGRKGHTVISNTALTTLDNPSYGAVLGDILRPFGGGVRPAPVQGWSRRY